VSETETIELLYNQSYSITCSSVGSKPDVTLILFDTNTNVSLSNGQNNITSGSCDQNTQLCNQILQIVFSYDSTNNFFDQMTSITCFAESKQPDLYPLSRSISRNVNVVLPPQTTIVSSPVSSSTVFVTTTQPMSTSTPQKSSSVVQTSTTTSELTIMKATFIICHYFPHVSLNTIKSRKT
jgi:hypothetical protein